MGLCMKKLVYCDEQAAGMAVAKEVQQLLVQKPDAVLCLAAGHSSLPVFESMVQLGLDFSAVRFIELDEWVGVPPQSEGSCTWFLNTHFFSRVNAKPENICWFNPLAEDLNAECTRMEQAIETAGGIDFLLLGMGMNGHLALNEPGDDFAKGVHVAPLSAKTKEVAVKYFPQDGMPPITKGITLGIRNMLASRDIVLTVFGEHKQPVAAQLLAATTQDENLPASALVGVAGARLVMDEAAAGCKATELC